MRSSSKFFVSGLLGLFLGTIGTAIIFNTVQNPAFQENVDLQIVAGAVLVPSLTIVFAIISYLLLPKND